MEEKNEIDSKNIDDVMMPGFRFHPTDEELVGFYLKRKLQQRPLPIELIKQVDIYKYDPWDLPKLAPSGEKEWYFYCPRDRKYRNSARPNRVTGSGFWKATGTDRPIYSSDGAKCIGLKKSLVFYKGRAAKGIKTDWMMHEFRLPSPGEPSSSHKKILDKSIPTSDSWAVCRIFKKTSSGAQRALPQSWLSPFGDTSPSDIFSHHFTSENISISSSTDIESVFYQSSTNENFYPSTTSSFPSSDVPISTSYRVNNPTLYKPYLPDNFMFSPLEMSSTPTKSTTVIDTSPMLLNPDFIGEPNGFSMSLLQDRAHNNLGSQEIDEGLRKGLNLVSENYALPSLRSLGFPFSLSPEIPDAWKPILPWESPPCP